MSKGIPSWLIVLVADVLGSLSALPALFYGVSSMWGVALQLTLIGLWAFVLAYFVEMWEEWRFRHEFDRFNRGSG